MNIQEAARKALKIKGYIVRESWPFRGIEIDDAAEFTYEHLRTVSGRIIEVAQWMPDADDLLADDWKCIKDLEELVCKTREKQRSTCYAHAHNN